MAGTKNTVESLRRIFQDSFVARDVAEPLASYDITTDTSVVRHFMVNRPLTVIGLRDKGIVTAFVEQDLLTDQPLSEQAVDLSKAVVIPTTAPVRDVVCLLNEHRFLLVSALGQPVAVIVRADLEKPAMRMWLFGMVTLFEMSITRVIDLTYPEDAWTDMVAEGRLHKARQLQDERTRRHQAVDLVDCLQLSDKGQLFAKSDELRTRYWDQSKRRILKVTEELERLRNNLAHSQPLVDENWEAIVRLAETMDRFLEIPPHIVSRDSLKPYDDAAAHHLDDPAELD